MKIRILLSCIFLITTFSFAQSKKGNIVQYFGKEKVEDINEGSILHLFNDGLLLKGKRFDKTHNTIETDAVFAQILSGDAPAINGKRSKPEKKTNLKTTTSDLVICI